MNSEELFFPNSQVGKKKIFFLLHAKMKGDRDVTESKYGTRNALSPTTSKGERSKVNGYVLIKKLTHFLTWYIEFKSINVIYLQHTQ